MFWPSCCADAVTSSGGAVKVGISMPVICFCGYQSTHSELQCQCSDSKSVPVDTRKPTHWVSHDSYQTVLGDAAHRQRNDMTKPSQAGRNPEQVVALWTAGACPRSEGRASCPIFGTQTSKYAGFRATQFSKLSDSMRAINKRWRGLQPDSVVGLSIRRSLVRAQVGEPIKKFNRLAPQVANLFFFVGLRVRLVSEVSRKLGMCPDRNSPRRPRSSRDAPLRTHRP